MNCENSKKVLIVATVGRFLDFERNNIKLLQEMGCCVYCAANMSEESDKKVSASIPDIKKCQIDFSRSPFTLNTIRAYRQLRKLLRTEKFKLIHCHTPVGGILTRLAARKYRKKGTKILYTAHGFHFYKGASLLNYFLFYPIEWVCSWWTDILITINTEDFELAKKRFHAKKTLYVPGVGIDINKFKSGIVNREKGRNKLSLTSNDVMLLSVGELNKNKNHSVVIRALAKINNPQIHYFIAGSGELRDSIMELARRLGIEKQIHLLGYRDDIVQLLKIADVFILPSRREGLNVSLMEAMASGLPCIVSKIRGNVDLVVADRCLVKADSVEGWRWAVNDMLNCIHNKKMLYMEENSRRIQRYEISIVSKHMKYVYQTVMAMK